MYLGKLEEGPVREVILDAKHPIPAAFCQRCRGLTISMRR